MSAPRIGPLMAVALRVMSDGRPITAARLAPHVAPNGTKGELDSVREQALRGARTTLATLARHGWATKTADGYVATPEGIASADGYRDEAEEVSVWAVLPDGMKRCWRCRRSRAIDDFCRDRGSHDGHMTRCKNCNSEAQSFLRAAKRLSRSGELHMAWEQSSKELIVYHAINLIQAARVARRTGIWHGRDGLRAYAGLGAALEPFRNDTDGALDPEANALFERPSLPVADPSDADWTRKAHTSPAHLREYFEVEA